MSALLIIIVGNVIIIIINFDMIFLKIYFAFKSYKLQRRIAQNQSPLLVKLFVVLAFNFETYTFLFHSQS